jgi:hypothetical protein
MTGDRPKTEFNTQPRCVESDNNTIRYSATRAGFVGQGRHWGQGMSADTVATKPIARAIKTASLFHHVGSPLGAKIRYWLLAAGGLVGQGRHCGQGMSADTVATKPIARAIKTASLFIMLDQIPNKVS